MREADHEDQRLRRAQEMGPGKNPETEGGSGQRERQTNEIQTKNDRK